MPLPTCCNESASTLAVITKSELLYGVEVSARQMQHATALKAFLPYLEVLEFADDATTNYAQIGADLKKRGQMIVRFPVIVPARETCE
jgi:predicted nucleic acid-binding protein